MVRAGSVLVYGANGYSGRMLTARLLRSGVDVIVAGRQERAIAELAATARLDYRVFDLSDAARIDAALDGARLVLNAAGPFHATAAPLVASCIRRGLHYLDIGGEIGPLQHARSLDRHAA